MKIQNIHNGRVVFYARNHDYKKHDLKPKEIRECDTIALTDIYSLVINNQVKILDDDYDFDAEVAKMEQEKADKKSADLASDQQSQAEIKKLKEKNLNQEKELSSLKNELEAIKKSLNQLQAPATPKEEPKEEPKTASKKK